MRKLREFPRRAVSGLGWTKYRNLLAIMRPEGRDARRNLLYFRELCWCSLAILETGWKVDATPLILCIDDEVLGLEIRKTVLERSGYRVVTAADGSSGLDHFWEHPIDAVVLDYFMPAMNGGQVAAEMRRRRPEIPILLLSAHIELPEEVVRLVDLTALKGDGPESLLAKIREVLTRRSRNAAPEVAGSDA
jgi:CheY-like chemotaxis protein